MKIRDGFRRTFFTLILLSFTILSVTPVQAAEIIFNRSLKTGMRGEDVRTLQKILNSSPDTAIQSVGVGSPGRETAYFGLFTHNAVVRFQEKYRDQILTPHGLSSGTGIVGPSTRVVLTSLLPRELGSSTVVATTKSANPNEENLEVFLAEIDRVAQKQSIPAGELAVLKNQILKDVATTTNLRKTFESTVMNDSLSRIPAPVRESFSTFIEPIKTSFFPKQATAQTGIPFGGAIVYSYFCACSASWLVTITPLLPTFVVLLVYQIGSQGFLSYNIPFTTWLLGEYVPGAGICAIYVGTGCSTIPSEGLISPLVGSSPL